MEWTAKKMARMRTQISATGKVTAIRGRRRQAFTLLEILVVLAVIVVAAGVIVPRMGRSLGRQELCEAAARFAHTARTVRALAVARQRMCAIQIDLDRGYYNVAIRSNQSGLSRLQAVQASWLKAGRWPETVKIVGYRTPDGSTSHAGKKQLKFFPDGSSSGASFRLTCGKDEYAVVVHPHSGRVVYGDTKTTFFAPDQYDLGG